MVSLMATDLWSQAKRMIMALSWRRPESPDIDLELERSRVRIVEAIDSDNLGRIQSELSATWGAYFHALILQNPEIVTEFRKLASELHGLEKESQLGEINFSASARDNARVYQQGQGHQYNG